MSDPNYDALLILSFGGPEGPDDVIPFLENVLKGKRVPRERLLEVAEHYNHFGGVSPINDQCRDLMKAVEVELQENGINLPVYWGNRNWHPLLPDTLRKMQGDGVKRILMFVTSGFSSYSGCRQYREDVENALKEIGPNDLDIHKLRVFYNHPDFIAVNAAHVQQAIDEVADGRPQDVKVAFTAHSVPDSMSSTSDYVQQLEESCRLIAEKIGLQPENWNLVYQSRSGRPEDPWLEPDICDHLEELNKGGVSQVVICAVGFLSDHMEVLYDLDDEAAQKCEELGIRMKRAATPGTSPQFITMIRKLIEERTSGCDPECAGKLGPHHNVCPADCCPAPVRISSARA